MIGDDVELACPRARNEPEDSSAFHELVDELEHPAVHRLRHDLRQPLATMTLMVETISSNGGLPSHVVTALDQICHEAQWMSRLLDSRVDDGGEVAVVDLTTALEGPCSLTPQGSQCEVHFTALGHVPVLVDPVGLERAARNLVDNAARAVRGGGLVDVRVWAEDRDGLLEVADSGPGFGHLAPQHGQGLVGVRRFAERFGGGLAFGTSSLGGALVTLRLPLLTGW
jgi:signal transduction histidine kinase